MEKQLWIIVCEYHTATPQVRTAGSEAEANAIAAECSNYNRCTVYQYEDCYSTIVGNFKERETFGNHPRDFKA